MKQTEDETTTEAQNYKTAPTTEDIERVFGDEIDSTLEDQGSDVAIIEDGGYGREDLVEAVRISAGGEWGHVHDDGNVVEVYTDDKDGIFGGEGVTVTSVSARENWDVVQDDVERFGVEGEVRRAFGSLIQTVHDRKSLDLLGRDDDPSDNIDVCVIIHGGEN